jgi:lactate permease
LLIEIGAIKALASLISTTGPYPALIAVTLLGALSGFVTGSGIAGNALFMPSAAATGANFDATTLFAALQHSAAGHMAMAALPVAAILLATLPGRTPEDDQNVMKIGLKLNLIFVCLIIGTGSAFLYLIIR